MKSHHLKPQFIVPALMLILLACGPMEQLLQFNRSSRAVATGVAIVDSGYLPALDAYGKLAQLPGYQLESYQVIRDQSNLTTTLTFTRQQDTTGNSHIVTQTPDGRLTETYKIDNELYQFDPQYNGWVAVQPISNLGTPPDQLLAQLATLPVESGHDTLLDRSATRYRLQHIGKDLLNQPVHSLTLRGNLWVDDDTGALLKSEIFLFQGGARQPSQEYRLTVTQVGNIPPVELPGPIVNPSGIMAATATARAWSLLQVKLNYQGQPVAFDMLPLQISQHQNSAHMELILNNLPPHLLTEPSLEPFLTYLGSILTLSIPSKNQVTEVVNFQVNETDLQNQSIGVTYFFNANLENFDHVELILSKPGGPLLAPIPVVGNK